MEPIGGDRARVEILEQGELLQITLNMPRANVIDAAMLEDLERALVHAASRPELKALLFTASGPHFSFGASVEEHRVEHAATMLEAFHGLFYRLLDLAIPTIAVVRGACLGGGMELVSFCNWIFADTSASFGQPEIKLAVFPPMASVLLPWRLGGGRALDLCVSGRAIPATEAHAVGLVHAVCDDPHAAAIAFFREHLADRSSSSLRFAERAVRLSLRDLFEQNLVELERIYLDELMTTPDASEGIAAFLEKRPPAYARKRGGTQP